MIKLILFCEYFIPEMHREAYHEWVQSHPELWLGIKLLENTEQPGIYVELQSTATIEEAAKLEKERREGRSWNEMIQWVKGNDEGLRIWIFRPVAIND
ncbi:hypothetical protein [Cohnella abietis]|uniref:YCII-related domain-containing protein n=1 Tax=Cohnella abietis TaxID=2507935 RepID=A0A3T1DAL8_9BACL|nr:hypothetical protein [Cohnella abietis]BBI35130.1 hypothetical protein KCTCHS21_45290 [Cohnella abietis]